MTLHQLRQYERNTDPEDIAFMHSPTWKRLRDLVVDQGKSACYLCHHHGGRGGDGMTADHVLSRTDHPELRATLSNLKPIHHDKCPVCGLRCNLIKGSGSAERAARIIGQRLARLGFDPVTGYPTLLDSAGEPIVEGRW